jgi:hypothetical protein
MTTETDALQPSRLPWLRWTELAVTLAGLLVVLWVCLTAWGGIVHGHPAYAILLGITVTACVLAGWLAVRRPARPSGRWRLIGRIVLALAGVSWIVLIAWLRPHTAVEPALAAMNSDAAVSVAETATEITFTPNAGGKATGVFFQPGALVDARAYAAVLRPLAEGGHTVVIVKQPLDIAFLAVGAFDTARSSHPEINGWVIGGHSLGGTVAAIQADAADSDTIAPAVGLFFYASYPAGDISTSLTTAVESISGTQDGLATPAKIEASRATLPADAQFTIINGGSHAQFGSYGPQPGDNTPTISDEDARQQIAAATARFVDTLSR